MWAINIHYPRCGRFSSTRVVKPPPLPSQTTNKSPATQGEESIPPSAAPPHPPWHRRLERLLYNEPLPCCGGGSPGYTRFTRSFFGAGDPHTVQDVIHLHELTLFRQSACHISCLCPRSQPTMSSVVFSTMPCPTLSQHGRRSRLDVKHARQSLQCPLHSATAGGAGHPFDAQLDATHGVRDRQVGHREDAGVEAWGPRGFDVFDLD